MVMFWRRRRCSLQWRRRQQRVEKRKRCGIPLSLFTESMKRAIAMYFAGYLFFGVGTRCYSLKVLLPLGKVLMMFHLSFTNLLALITFIEPECRHRTKFLFLLLLSGLHSVCVLRHYLGPVSPGGLTMPGNRRPFCHSQRLPMGLVRGVRVE